MCGGDAPGRLEEPTEVSVETTGQSTVVDPEQDKQKNQVLPTSDSGSDSTGGTSVAEEVAQEAEAAAGPEETEEWQATTQVVTEEQEAARDYPEYVPGTPRMKAYRTRYRKILKEQGWRCGRGWWSENPKLVLAKGMALRRGLVDRKEEVAQEAAAEPEAAGQAQAQAEDSESREHRDGARDGDGTGGEGSDSPSLKNAVPQKCNPSSTRLKYQYVDDVYSKRRS